MLRMAARMSPGDLLRQRGEVFMRAHPGSILVSDYRCGAQRRPLRPIGTVPRKAARATKLGA
jgi:hypothetical protein